MVKKRTIPFTLEQIQTLARSHPTPFYIYDEEGIRNSTRSLFNNFSWNKGFKEYFPIKATPNPEILSILKDEGCCADCCSVPELMLAEGVGLIGESIMLTSNDTGPEEFKMARKMGAIINLDDPNHLAYIEKTAGLPKVLCLRYNPGPFKKKGKLTWRHLTDEKFGMRKDQLFETYKQGTKKGIKRFGLHMMIMSNDLHGEHFVDTARICFDIAVELNRKAGIKLEFIDLGGGIGIPYRPHQKSIDMRTISNKIRTIYNRYSTKKDFPNSRLFMESGRFITGKHGYLVAKVRHIKKSYKNFAGLDASMADLMRPGMYGSYHHISVLGKQSKDPTTIYDVVGSLCENNDKFAINRKLPLLDPGDIIVFHDVGAYGRGKVFDFNGKLRPAEFLLRNDGSFQQIRRAETPQDYFRTICGWKTQKGILKRTS
ncbi:MAG: diaminopimelate decarboxylase [Candidatus Berkelbacteria bacterium]|nr:diaminopimelate decarboxylase [Candidatus Berkelbacteria bacterium]